MHRLWQLSKNIAGENYNLKSVICYSSWLGPACLPVEGSRKWSQARRLPVATVGGFWWEQRQQSMNRAHWHSSEVKEWGCQKRSKARTQFNFVLTFAILPKWIYRTAKFSLFPILTCGCYVKAEVSTDVFLVVKMISDSGGFLLFFGKQLLKGKESVHCITVCLSWIVELNQSYAVRKRECLQHCIQVFKALDLFDSISQNCLHRVMSLLFNGIPSETRQYKSDFLGCIKSYTTLFKKFRGIYF